MEAWAGTKSNTKAPDGVGFMEEQSPHDTQTFCGNRACVRLNCLQIPCYFHPVIWHQVRFLAGKSFSISHRVHGGTSSTSELQIIDLVAVLSWRE